MNVPIAPQPASRRAPPFGVATAVALLAGITTCALLPALPPWPLLAALGAAGAWGWWRAGHVWRVSRRIAGAALLGMALFGLHAGWALSSQLPVAMERSDVAVRGQVVELPVDEPRRTSFRFRVDDDRSQSVALRGKLLQLSWYDAYGKPQPSRRREITPGSRWSMTVRVRAPRGLRNPGVLDSERSALAQRIAAAGYVRDPLQARELAPPGGVDAWRDAMSMRIARDVAAPSSRFVRALALGDTRGLADIDWDVLRAAGLTHLIAISGFHVGMVASVCALLVIGLWRLWPALARRVPRPQAAAVAALLGAFGYAAVAGFALPTVRTALMIAIVVLARLMRRQARVTDALALAALAVLLVGPLSVLGAGFWLSFAGVAWLAWCLPDAGTRVLRDFLSAQGVATLGLLPLTVVLFGQASLAGPVANLVAIPWWSFVVVPLSLVGTGLEALHAGLGAWAWRTAAWCFDLAWPLFEWLASSDVALWWLPEARSLLRPGHVGTLARGWERHLGVAQRQVAAHAGGKVQDHVDARRRDALDHLGVERDIARGLAGRRVADVNMSDGGAGLRRLDAGRGDLCGCHGHMVGPARGVAGTGHGAGDEGLAARFQRHDMLPLVRHHAQGKAGRA